jgi:hypothetical protein
VNTPQPSIIDQIADERDELRDENNRLKHRIELLESANSDVARIAKERDDSLERVKRLKQICNRYGVRQYNGNAFFWNIIGPDGEIVWDGAGYGDDKPLMFDNEEAALACAERLSKMEEEP